MKKQFFIANWKSHKTPLETEEWFLGFAQYNGLLPKEKEVIVCPPYPLIPACVNLASAHALQVKVGAQDISAFPEGAYTGEVSGKLLSAYASFVIIGHSERRHFFSETDQVLSEKVLLAQAHLLTPIFCVRGIQDPVPPGVSVVAYEPVEAIGSGKPADPDVVEEIAHSIKLRNGVSYVLYGGSVAPQNVATYTQLPSIDGVLVGGASLDPQEFAKLIQHA